MLFVVTGVCQAGERLSLMLPRFLLGPDTQVLLWVDFKEPADYAALAEEVATHPGMILRVAPPALWGGISIVRSMLAAIDFAINRLTGWQQLVFCSLRDVPLLPCAKIAKRLREDWAFDYCGSRWNARTSDLLRPLSTTPMAALEVEPRAYEFHQIRLDATIAVETALTTLYPAAAVLDLRLCGEMYERYLSAALESPSGTTLFIRRLTPARAAERHAFFTEYGLYAGRQWCILSRCFCEMLGQPETTDLLTMFDDMLIPDECFFQSVAAHHANRGRMTVRWENAYYGDAQLMAVTPQTLAWLLEQRSAKLFARKAHPCLDEASLPT